jgi:NADPH2:quinone reductase
VRAAVCKEYGEPETVTVDELASLVPGPGEVVVRVAAAAVNFPDVLFVADQYQVSVPVPFTPGSEFAGEVVTVGDGVTDLTVGQPVFGSVMVGAFAEEVLVPASSLTPAPDGVELQAAAGFGVAYGTAYHSLRSVGRVQPGEWVAVLGAAGGVGLAAVDVAAALGARVVAVASTEEKRAVCLDHGAEAAIDPAFDVRDGLREATDGVGVDVIIDPVGGPLAERALRAGRWGGRFVTVGYASGEIPRIPLNLVLLKGVTIVGFEMRTFGLHAPEEAARDRRELMELFAAGRLHPHIGARFPLDDTAAALRHVADRKAIGKVIIEP